MDHKEIVDLARAVYVVVRKHATTKNGKVSYSDLCAQLGGRWAGMEARSPLLAAALGTIVEACRAAGLPALSALVVHAGSDQRPGEGYFKAAHPTIKDEIEQEVAWAKEFEAAHKAAYPNTFDEL